MTKLERCEYEHFVYCRCGCGLTRPRVDKWGDKHEFIAGHQRRGQGKGWHIDAKGYRWIKFSLSEHHDSHLDINNGFVLEHRLVWEQSRQCCLLPWGDVHHLNVHNLTPEENKLDNSPENLLGIMHGDHLTIHKKKDMSERFCLICESETTYIDIKGWPNWFKFNDGFICLKCYCREWRKERLGYE